jgi:hypothetical protein
MAGGLPATVDILYPKIKTMSKKISDVKLSFNTDIPVCAYKKTHTHFVIF